MIRRPPRPPIKMMQPIALDLANSVISACSQGILTMVLFCCQNAEFYQEFTHKKPDLQRISILL